MDKLSTVTQFNCLHSPNTIFRMKIKRKKGNSLLGWIQHIKKKSEKVQNFLIVLALFCKQQLFFTRVSVFLNYLWLTSCKPQLIFRDLPSAIKPLIIVPLTIYTLNPVFGTLSVTARSTSVMSLLWFLTCRTGTAVANVLRQTRERSLHSPLTRMWL